MPFKFSKEQMNEMRELFDSGSVAAIITTTNYSGAPVGIASIRLLRYNDGVPCGPSIFINVGRSSAGLINEGFVFNAFSMVCTMLTVWGLDVYHPNIKSEWRLFTPEAINAVNVYHYEDALDLLTHAMIATHYQKEETASAMAPMPPHLQPVSSGIHPGSAAAVAYQRRTAQSKKTDLGPPEEVLKKLRESSGSPRKTFDQMINERVREKHEESVRRAKEQAHNNEIQVAIDDFEKYPEFEDIY